MDAVGVVCEFDPMHLGHERLLRQAKADTGLPVVCAMSGNYIQRGGMACLNKFARAEMAVLCGADLVVELPTPWAMATAERFADGGVSLLAGCGVKHLYFGSECGDIAALDAAAEALLREEFQADILRDHVTPYGIQTAPGASLPAVSQFSVASAFRTASAGAPSERSNCTPE